MHAGIELYSEPETEDNYALSSTLSGGFVHIDYWSIEDAWNDEAERISLSEADFIAIARAYCAEKGITLP